MDTDQRRESGSVAVFAAVFVAFVAIGVAALAFDGGSLFQTQRSLVTNTDAMALAGAGELAEMGFCDLGEAEKVVRDAVDDYKELNDPDLQMDEQDVEVEVDCEDNRYSGTVRVTAREESDTYFSGQSDLGVRGWTEVGFTREFITSSTPGEDVLLSPLAFCEAQLEKGEVDVYYSKPPGEDIPEMCEGPSHGGTAPLPGGWGWLKDGATSEQLEMDEFICTDDDDANENWCAGDPGNNTLQHWVVEQDDRFFFPIFDKYKDQGNNQEWRIIGYGEATLIGCSGSSEKDTDYDPGNCQGNPTFMSLDVHSLDATPSTSMPEFTSDKTDPDLSITDVSSR